MLWMRSRLKRWSALMRCCTDASSGIRLRYISVLLRVVHHHAVAVDHEVGQLRSAAVLVQDGAEGRSPHVQHHRAQHLAGFASRTGSAKNTPAAPADAPTTMPVVNERARPSPHLKVLAEGRSCGPAGRGRWNAHAAGGVHHHHEVDVGVGWRPARPAAAAAASSPVSLGPCSQRARSALRPGRVHELAAVVQQLAQPAGGAVAPSARSCAAGCPAARSWRRRRCTGPSPASAPAPSPAGPAPA
jgi:hypothetical protein